MRIDEAYKPILAVLMLVGMILVSLLLQLAMRRPHIGRPS